MSEAALTSGEQFGGYKIEGLVAGGGMGRVYAARHAVYGSPVALKVLHAELGNEEAWRKRFSEEGLIGLQLKHPHIASARELVEQEGRLALVLDLVSGGMTLHRLVSRNHQNGLPLDQALAVLLGIVQGVEYAHAKGVVHGDLKPENVLIEGEALDPAQWVPRVTDFGTVALMAHPVVIDGQSAVVVSPRYASPEHIRGLDAIHKTSDIYCLGLLLHYLVTGRHASTAASVGEAVDVVTRPLPVVTLVDAPDAVIALFQRCTMVDPEDRYQDCRDLALAIRDVLDGLGIGLDLEDLQADLATEVMEERQDMKDEAARKRLLENVDPFDDDDDLDDDLDLEDNLEPTQAPPPKAAPEAVKAAPEAVEAAPEVDTKPQSAEPEASEAPAPAPSAPTPPPAPSHTATPAPAAFSSFPQESSSNAKLAIIGGLVLVLVVLLGIAAVVFSG
ncbi:MAG: serine/threonine protein kinase [Deltaproteobacteria bacterium]|nr:MAG: serine/threonine protein kinase [Deltaproteobacteria bacterium]